ncbi:TolC family protein [candidate division KSB1 bacterium]|nr:TolC family protein [candidate division KSB1 bacterium]
MRITLTALVFLLFAGIGTAQNPLSLDEALRLARQNNLQLKKQQQKQKIAEMEVAIKRGQLLPSLDVSATSSYTDEIAKFDLPFTLPGSPGQVELGGHDRTELAIGVRQPLFTGFRLQTQVDLAKTALESEQTLLAFLNQQTAYQVYLLFYQAQSLKKERRIQAASLARLDVQLEQARSLFKAAQVMAYDTLQVYNQTLQLKILLDQNQRDQRLVDLQMARLLDLPEVRPITEADLQKPSLFSLRLDSLKQTATQRRPELSGVRLGQRSAQLSRKLAKSSYFPDVGAEAKYHYAKPGLNQVANEWMDYSTIGVSLQWNLWRWQQDRHRVEAAEVEYNRLTIEERELLRSIDYEVERSWENANFAAKQIQLAEHLLAQQQERYRIIGAQQREGVATTNDVIVAEADLTQAELQLQRALIQYYLSQSEILLATGAIVE